MKVSGYSERGAVNSLLYEIAYCQFPEQYLGDLLATMHFPGAGDLHVTVTDAEVLVEQSLSDFGDADAILLLRTASRPLVVFLEAKVRTSQASSWRIEQELAKFRDGTRSGISSSNLFFQMYSKLRLVHALSESGGVPPDGLAFPSSSSKSRRNIGSNPVVLRAIEKVREHLDRAYFVALVPDVSETVSRAFAQMLPTCAPPDLPHWDVSCFGYLTWHEVQRYCEQHCLIRTLSVLDFNRGQIY